VLNLHEAEPLKVYRVGNDFPITLVLPLKVEHVPESDDSMGILLLALQADVNEDRRVEVIYVDSQNYPFPVASAPTPEQLKLMAESAFTGLGIRHPGVMDLYNFALRQGVMFDGRA